MGSEMCVRDSFSSTALIGAMEEQTNPFQARLRQLIEQGEIDSARLEPLIESFVGKRVCVLGETIVDTYVPLTDTHLTLPTNRGLSP